MLDRIIHFSIYNKLIIGIFTLALVVWGGYSVTQLPIDAVPDITNNQVQVITTSPSLAAQEVERLISFPVEQTMSTIADIEEVRSISRFGLSVVTIVFEDNVDIYWARQQVSERLVEAKNIIPDAIGSPEMAPISTGLGEIYQYVVHPKPGYEEQYDAMELRTIQDWIIRRQLLGTPGVAEVNSFGGFVKQYEVAIDPARLRSYNLSISDILAAMERNNQNTGGAYIDKKPNAYFIRSEGLIRSLDEIKKVVVTNTSNGTPVLISDIAQVRFGSANRYGALTDATGEAVGGIVMLLKGENTNQVVDRVKERLEQIRKSLPEGVEIQAFLDRSELIGRAIGTVEKNLIEGALIVIFVLVLFLGNFRAGLVVASVIPLAMLFAIIMMNLFGVTGNLMSLGAIDFGLIVDGAVIIVEATMHHLGLRDKGRLTQAQMDEEVYESARKIRSAAAFGEIIILIVYLPILALVGIEGKMFRPMALTVSFAILGAFILSLTYVPMMSALLLSKNITHKRTISDRMMDFFQRLYRPVIRGALRFKALVLVSAFALFALSLVLFSRMGSEFIPTLEEGDFALETRLLTGSSLSETIEKVTLASRILKEQFPEVKDVISKIGAAEIPTDPMPMEAADVTITLKDKEEWTSAATREELANKMTEALEAIPGVTFGVSQPIQLRSNELISGVRQDVGIKIFGEDLQELTRLSKEVGGIVSTVQGAEDLYLEQVSGLPQIVVDINRDQVAKFGLDVETVNQAINAAFAGQGAGMVYEGDRRFDLVVRLTQQERQDIANVRQLFVTAPSGMQVPLEQVADIAFRQGPNQIQREDAKRRIIVGFNVRGRDVASVVEEVQQKIDQQVQLPTGYFVTYGGQFENLQEANKRLSVAVPAALALIFLLLFFTFGSVRHSLLIFTAIPLSAIGGVLALWLRDMPFSISAGVGFIALFGVAVLNGIVLIAEFNRQRKEHNSLSLRDVVLNGTSVRLRPVLMTAAVASLGFLPMALSNTAGAEVQKPLATVVIGGLITSTLLTLVVLPVLYILIEGYFSRRNQRKASRSGFPVTTIVTVIATVALLMGKAPQAQAQQRPVSQQPVEVYTLEEAVAKAIKRNPSVEAARLGVKRSQSLKGAAWDINKTQLQYSTGKLKSGEYDSEASVSQTFAFPTVYAKQAKLAEELTQASRIGLTQRQREVVRDVRLNYYGQVYALSRLHLLTYQDSLYTAFLRAAQVRLRTGETNLLEQVTAETQLSEVRNSVFQAEADRAVFQERLQALLATDTLVATADTALNRLPLPSITEEMLEQNPRLRLARQQVEVRQAETKLERARLLPDLQLGYTNRNIAGNYGERGVEEFEPAQEVSIGVAIPLWPKPQRSRIEAARIQADAARMNLQDTRNELRADVEAALQQALKLQGSLDYYGQTALPQAELIINQATKAYRAGEINYQDYILSLNRALAIRTNYLDALYLYDKAVIELNFLLENQ
ncbi:cobalt-zinc-cadmium resistance protein CzcA [Pontibacter ummariensis]|uniref:Cobalt-zinc-cadmium resistance protein CzcA n=1 Tax=Pontibacter ummariensis TaxID=1610492 RepID=A0A239JB50_9BACT|nr:CusA/CzcA family heavy metal efflux RND transporter [Pontibacter ummariensis]PRY08341.1 cobalt-zinc-cadmium resistance protein CzcA [Pontibacter ummariensis]SNT03080.1 cobalt-zinc-cadmium resistance protein CzcA [Pontibacter ummariensis]